MMSGIMPKFSKIRKKIAYALSKRRKRVFDLECGFLEVKKVFPEVNDQYDYFHHYFWNRAPRWVREHRAYFNDSGRGFGEDAFHAMWYLIFKGSRPKLALEIGVYRGQVVSLWAMLAEKLGIECEIHGISPFTSTGDSVSEYLKDIDYYADTVGNCGKFAFKIPVFHKGFSTGKSMRDIIESKKWDLIYIDGNHDYEVAKADFIICSNSLRRGGLLVLDDSALETCYKPAAFAKGGHYGPSRVAGEIDQAVFEEVVFCGHNRVFLKR